MSQRKSYIYLDLSSITSIIFRVEILVANLLIPFQPAVVIPFIRRNLHIPFCYLSTNEIFFFPMVNSVMNMPPNGNILQNDPRIIFSIQRDITSSYYDRHITSIYGKNGFANVSKNLIKYSSENNLHENNYVKRSTWLNV